MTRFIEGEPRTQSTLFPERLDDYVSDDNPVKVVEAFIEALDLERLGFHGMNPKLTGRPAYHPSTMLKIFLYGYLNRIQSSRRLERETQRNVELMWLTGRLSPDFKTIANFRKDNGKGIRRVCRQFVGLCRQFNLFSHAMVAIDGSKFKAVNNWDRNFTKAKTKRRLQQIDESIDRYLEQIARADLQESGASQLKADRLQNKIRALKKEVIRLNEIEAQMEEAEETQLSLTDPDARSMATTGRGTGVVGYNVQAAVDTEHHLIVAHQVTNVGHDRHQLFNMAKQAKSAMGAEGLEVVADRGYFKSGEILACVDAGMTPFVPKPLTSGNRARGLFDKQDFRYVPETDEYRCPAGERLPRRTKTHDHGKTVYRYWSLRCGDCALKPQCTIGRERRVTRWENEQVLETMQARLDRDPEKMRIRRATVEHPFGTLKAWMGPSHFLTRTFDRVSTEMSLHVLAYNLKRVMNIMGVKALIEAIQALIASLIHLLRRIYAAPGVYRANERWFHANNPMPEINSKIVGLVSLNC